LNTTLLYFAGEVPCRRKAVHSFPIVHFSDGWKPCPSFIDRSFLFEVLSTPIHADHFAIATMKVFSVLLNFAALALAASRTTAPSGALVVGSGQKYTTST
jgi:hypothetical protein